MTKRKWRRKTSKPFARLYIVFGPDEYARPRAATYWARQVRLLAGFAAAMNVRFVEVSERLCDVAMKVPPGCIRERYLPYVSGETYAELAAATVFQLRRDHPAATGEFLPRHFDEVAPGHLVLARETRECGWWEAVVLERNDDDMLTLRYRDYPDYPAFVRYRSAVALMAAPAPDPAL
jgi:hypothetical protein